MLPRCLLVYPYALGRLALFLAPGRFVNNGKSFQSLVGAGEAVIDKAIKVLMTQWHSERSIVANKKNISDT